MSSASLAPLAIPWLKMSGFGGSPAKPVPPWTFRELLLKSVKLPCTALQLAMRWSAEFCFEKKASSGIVCRGPVAKIQVTPSASPSGWQDPQELQPLSEALFRKASGTMSRMSVSRRPLSGVPSAVKKTSLD